MCEFCVKHGEGKKWYLNAKNYSQDMLNDIKRREFTKDFFYWLDRTYNKYFNFMKRLPLHVPLVGPALKTMIKRIFMYEHWGQVLPVEDVEKVLTMTNSVVRIPCICRRISTGKLVRTCFMTTLSPQGMGVDTILDQSYFGGPDVAKFEKWSKKDALDFIKEEERNGKFHSIWTWNAPFIGGICNCDDTGCLAYNVYKEVTPFFFRAEYIIELDKDKCVGCKECINICPFHALEYDAIDKKGRIKYEKCYGCGICRSICKQNALRLIDRRNNAITRTLWY